MQFSKISALASLLAFASGSLHTEEVAVVCTDADPVTVTQTVTVTAPCSINPGGPIITSSPAPTPTPVITTAGGSITSIDKSGSKTFVWVYPTGTYDQGQDATVSIWVDNVVIEVIVVNINVTIINGHMTTIYSTKTDLPHWTPTPPPVVSTTSSAASTSTPVIHNFIVGVDGILTYGANQINAAIGDIIRFDFNSTNHTVTQSDFLTPCSPKAGGFNTDFGQFNPTNHTGVIFKDFLVNVSTPLWFYCAQTFKISHCHKGMVLGVNPAGKFPAFLGMATATATSSISLSTGNSKPFSTGISKPFSTGPVTIPLSTGTPAKGSGPVVPPKPTGTGAYYPKERRAGGKQWFA